jgi:hypothetical protein
MAPAASPFEGVNRLFGVTIADCGANWIIVCLAARVIQAEFEMGLPFVLVTKQRPLLVARMGRSAGIQTTYQSENNGRFTNCRRGMVVILGTRTGGAKT